MKEIIVFFRVDASHKIGIGHVMRCLTLSEELIKRGIKIVFICAELEGNSIQLIKARDIEVHSIKDNTQTKDYEKTKEVLDNYPCQNKVLVVDSYLHDIQWETLIKSHIDLLISINDSPRIHDVDILINNNYKAEMITFYQDNMVNIKKLLGASYILVRPEFINYRMMDIKKEYKVHVFFGGSDYNNYTYLYSNKILECEKKIKVHAVVTNYFAYEDLLKKLKDQYGTRFEYSVSPRSMAEGMASCNVAIGAPGTTTWERMAMGLPCAYLATNINQIPILRDIQNDKLGIYLGKANKETYFEQIQNFLKFIENKSFQTEIAKNGKKLIDGQGSKRITDIIISTLQGSK
ncbi:UDP-2,4-diacetamido-2,4,6-trideoxy-beta-L-altropyranose hydrolase [Lysinibacillus tabacifolii]|uniref:UDP-2,4-diacetamido-2,4, 6-trideoxy-beta-L-altropyranose hydrolase n=1 Tax=Lysinibacillus tabacifolii TaxID=1173107 RepID=A0ABY2SZM1_9BACI|nr:UDP-2,4-diacetamido-2,4,6-trideoxy-beta-L-altropyranose hydrolase [Lysinibacillus tabacifolii]TKI48731.1 UDP-2,4-diacetamido-2,4,6-trideoxy-beta-L-altropyranose hydrolase [Lysinibacillus tabacifolii]